MAFNAISNPTPVVSEPSIRAVSLNRTDWALSSALGLGFRFGFGEAIWLLPSN
jgi:hypothetical protein